MVHYDINPGDDFTLHFPETEDHVALEVDYKVTDSSLEMTGERQPDESDESEESQ